MRSKQNHNTYTVLSSFLKTLLLAGNSIEAISINIIYDTHWRNLQHLWMTHESFSTHSDGVEQTARKRSASNYRVEAIVLCTQTANSKWMKSIQPIRIRWSRLFGLFNFKWYMIKCFAPTLSIQSLEVNIPMQTICHNCDRNVKCNMYHRPTGRFKLKFN